MEQKNFVEQIREKTMDISIRRVPKKTKRWFIEYANEEYEGDYGMLLKCLVDFYRGMLSETMLSGMTQMDQKLDKLLERTNPQTEQIEEKGRMMADGKIRR